MFSKPALKENFFGRDDFLLILNKRLRAFQNGYRQNVAILGPHLLGKTSLIYQFLNQQKDDKTVPVYVEIKSEPFRFLVHKFIGVFLFNYLKTLDKTIDNQLDHLLEKCSRYLPATFAAIKSILAQTAANANDRAFYQLLELPVIFYRESHKPCLLIFDEFQNLESLKISNPFQTLSTAIMMQKTTLYIVTSSLETNARKIIAEKLNLLFGNFEIVTIHPFDTHASKTFLEHRLSGLQISDADKKFLYNLTRGHPFYMDLLCGRLRQLFREKKEANTSTAELLPLVLNDLLFNPHGALHQYFVTNFGRLLENHSYSTFSLVLNAMAKEHKKSAAIAKNINRPLKDINRHLSLLSEMEIVRRVGVFYQLSDPLLTLWLKYVYQKRQSDFSTDFTSLSASFNAAMEKNFSAFQDLNQKNLAEIIAALFTQFNDETIEIKGKRYKLPRFKHIEIKTEENFQYLVATTASNKLWTCLVENTALGEQKITEFILHLKRKKIKPQRKILAAQHALDDNSRLKALAEKFLIWGMDELNLVANLYNLCSIVRW